MNRHTLTFHKKTGIFKVFCMGLFCLVTLQGCGGKSSDIDITEGIKLCTTGKGVEYKVLYLPGGYFQVHSRKHGKKRYSIGTVKKVDSRKAVYTILYSSSKSKHYSPGSMKAIIVKDAKDGKRFKITYYNKENEEVGTIQSTCIKVSD